jgi:hypothetical protein
MNGRDQHRRPTLETWQAIADYLGVSKRTAQNYERFQKLPVYRLEGDKARVWAYPEELEAWKAGFQRTAREEYPSAGEKHDNGAGAVGEIPPTQGISEHSPPTAELISERIRSQPIAAVAWSADGKGRIGRRWLLSAGLGIIGISTTAGLATRTWGRRRLPAAYRIQGTSLIVLSDDNRLLWKYPFSQAPSQNPFGGPLDSHLCLFHDVNGDGQVETLFRYATVKQPAVLLCFSATGKLLWRFVPGRTIYGAQGSEYSPPYGVNALDVLPADASGVARVVVSSVHHYGYPCQVALVDGETGRLISEYWHRGHLRNLRIADLDGDGEAEIILGGVNDAEDYRQATLVIFDQHRVVGGSQDPNGQPYFRGLLPGQEKAEIFFPKTPLSRDKEFNIVRDINLEDKRLRVTILEDIGETGSTDELGYEFDPNLRHVEVMLSNTFSQHYRSQQQKGEIPAKSLAVLAKELQGDVQVIFRNPGGPGLGGRANRADAG